MPKSNLDPKNKPRSSQNVVVIRKKSPAPKPKPRPAFKFFGEKGRMPTNKKKPVRIPKKWREYARTRPKFHPNNIPDMEAKEARMTALYPRVKPLVEKYLPPKQPYIIGIDTKLFWLFEAMFPNERTPMRRMVQRIITGITNSPGYIKRTAAADYRYDLNGEKRPLLERHKIWALNRLNEIQEERDEKIRLARERRKRKAQMRRKKPGNSPWKKRSEPGRKPKQPSKYKPSIRRR